MHLKAASKYSVSILGLINNTKNTHSIVIHMKFYTGKSEEGKSIFNVWKCAGMSRREEGRKSTPAHSVHCFIGSGKRSGFWGRLDVQYGVGELESGK
jgi:hypothetical protein